MSLKVIRQLGIGGSSEIYLVTDDKDNKYVIKIIKNEHKNEGINEKNILEYLPPICRKYSVSIHSSKLENENIVLIMDYKPGTIELYNYLENNFNQLNKFNRLVIMKNLIYGLSILHSCGVVHRDINPLNILLNPNTLDIYYIDFGLACLKDSQEDLKWSESTTAYMAPELFKDNIRDWNSNKAADIWALGLTFIDIAFFNIYKGEFYPYDYVETPKRIKKYNNKDIDKLLEKIPSTEENTFFIKLIRPMLEINWRKRSTAQKILGDVEKIVI